MAELKYCPNCKISRECTKKGTNAAGEQLWFCKTCEKRFTLITAPKKVTPKKVAAKVAATKVAAPKVKGTTEIIVNNNSIKTVPGLLTIDQAFDMVSSYFKEIAKERAEISEFNDKKTIKFKVIAGSKG